MPDKKNRLPIIQVVCICVSLLWGVSSPAITPKQMYIDAEVCYKKLRQSPRKMKYRDQWLRCIERFQGVQRLDPSGPWAAAGLYQSGLLYLELAKRSGSNADYRQAFDIFQTIVEQFPESRYRAKAATKIHSLSSKAVLQTTAAKKAVRASDGAFGEQYDQAESCYKGLRSSARKVKYRDNWLRCIDKFDQVYKKQADDGRAAAGLFMSAKLYTELYRHSRRKSDLQAGYDRYRQVIEQFPDSRFNEKAAFLTESMPAWVRRKATVEDDRLAKIIEKGEEAAPGAIVAAPHPQNTASGRMVMVEDLRFWSNPNYTRIVIDASRETSYYHHLLKKDPALNKPQRLYVDLKDSRLGENIKKRIPINDDLLMNARAGQYTHESVRVVVDIKSFKTYKIFSLNDPFRIVIDVWGTDQEKETERRQTRAASKTTGSLPAGALAKQLALGISRIIIDPGHGGHDYGAPGYLKGVHEKDVVLQIARRLAKKIRRELGLQVFLTRNSDRFLTLEERTAIANTKNADLFISIHTNSHRNRRAYGIETYFLNLATDDDAIRVAAVENATSTKNISDLQNILFDLMQNAKINESSRLAGHVQVSLVNHLKDKRYSRIKDKGVKQAPFYVLLGAQMPAVLVETSFISNPRECKRLINPRYQERLCEAIVAGIKRYIRETTPTAYRHPAAEFADNG